MQLHTLNTFAKEHNLTKASAINKIAKLKAKGFVKTKGGGKQPRLYEIYNQKQEEENGLYQILNLTPVKIRPTIKHFVQGAPMTIEQAIVDALAMKEIRHTIAAMYLCNRIVHWTTLIHALIKQNLLSEFKHTYQTAKQSFRVRRIPKRYEKMLAKVPITKNNISKEEILDYKHD